ncbi:hypothetical protein DITRI_Ditri03aG0100000 [Diplodiscus trichospermus]
MTRTSFDDSTSPLLSKMPHDCVPLVELDLAHSSRPSNQRSWNPSLRHTYALLLLAEIDNRF